MSNVPSVSSISEQEAREQLHKLLGEMLINITNQVFRDRSFYIDGYRFINCSFINCKLYVYRGTFEFHRCFFTGTNSVYGAEALKCIQSYFKYKPELAVNPGFKPIIHEDGSLSIGQGASLD